MDFDAFMAKLLVQPRITTAKKAPLLNGPIFRWWSTRVWTMTTSRFTDKLVIGVINLDLLEKPLNIKKTASQEFVCV
jgi:hypothetical protein